MKAISVNSLSISFRKAPILNNISLEIETGEFFIIKAKAVVLTTGWVSRLFFYAGNQWRGNWGYEGGGACSTGDGIAMAFKAGAELIQMESSHPSRAAYGSSNQPIAGGSAVDDRRGDSLWPAMLVDAQGNPVPTMMGPFRNPHGVGIGNVPFFIAPGGTNDSPPTATQHVNVNRSRNTFFLPDWSDNAPSAGRKIAASSIEIENGMSKTRSSCPRSSTMCRFR